MRTGHLLMILAVSLALVRPAGAQTQITTAVIEGVVVDSSGAVLPGVDVEVRNVDTNISQQASSNQVGDFTIPYLNPGRYTLETTAAGFRSLPDH